MSWSRYPLIYIFIVSFGALSCAPAHAFSLFKCDKREGPGYTADFNWNSYDYSGFKWISCVVEAPEVVIDGIKLNRGNCGVLDQWFLDRRFTQGETLNITYSCLSPVLLEIDANSRTSTINLK